MMKENYFKELAKLDVNEHVEKKGGFGYLSWAWAVDQLKKKHPDATWEVKRFEGMPFLKTELGYFVEVAVTVEEITHSQIHPVLDNRNKPIEKPNTFQINTSIQRCLVKAIALHGLGLYIYAGEDLPHDEDAKAKEEEQRQNFIKMCRELSNTSEGIAKELANLERLANTSLDKFSLALAERAYNKLNDKLKEEN
jgi:hypothetical protein